MTQRTRTGPRKPRAAFVVGFLLATMALATVLAYQALDAARSHRATAENVLRDYAAAAAKEYAQRAARELEYYGFYPTFQILAGRNAGHLDVALAPPGVLEPGGEQAKVALGFVRYFFRLELESHILESAGAQESDPGLGWLADTLPDHVRHTYDSEWRSALLIRTGPEQEIFAYTVEYAGADRAISAYGMALKPAKVRELLALSATHDPLLPPTLMRDLQPDSVLNVRVTDAEYGEIYGSETEGSAPAGPYSPTFAANATLGTRYGGLTARVSIRPDAADRLIIGGLPRSRLPLLMGLLALTVGLVVAALYQLRREHELTRLRTEFVSNVSHELRTPLAQIRMFAETLLLGRVRTDEERDRSLQIIDQEARRLTHLVENVLHFSRTERRVTRLAPEPTRIGRLVTETTETFAPLAAARGMPVVTELSMAVEAEVDPSAVQQMLLNLLDNAVKYGPPHQTITVGVELHDGSVRIRVDDEGQGVPTSDRERIWERFWRQERQQGEQVTGTGIGLSVVRELATLHGGRTWVQDAPGGGARFVLEFPGAARVAPTEREPAPSADSGVAKPDVSQETSEVA